MNRAEGLRPGALHSDQLDEVRQVPSALTAPLRVTRQSYPSIEPSLGFAERRAVQAALRLERGSIDATLPDGRRLLVEGPLPGPNAVVRVNSRRFYRRFLSRGDVGVGEAFMAGEWESPHPTALLELFAVNVDALQDELMAGPAMRLLLALQHWLNRNTRSGARRNIAAHYDLGNDFYAAWLDGTMTYSSALYERGANDLETAQRDKYRALIERTGITKDHHVLEVGCGWGGFAETAALEVGCHVTALTISEAQKAFAEERIRRLGLEDRVRIELRDYRDERGSYDRIVSIEMFEAVGERYWPAFFEMLRARLRPGGRAGLQIITVRDDLFENYRKSADFIQRYIFPGGMLPPMDRLRALSRHVGLTVERVADFGQDYARTLAEWQERFTAAWPRIATEGFDERFRRMWLFYLHYCEAGFRAGTIDVRQIVVAKG